MDKLELKPCPFCGGGAAFAGGNYIIPVMNHESIVDVELEYWPVRVVCKSCLASTNEFCAENDDKNYEDAAKAWNRRAGNG